MISLLEARTIKRIYAAVCERCGACYEFDVGVLPGCGDRVTISCECGATLGHVRSDIGGNKTLRRFHRIQEQS